MRREAAFSSTAGTNVPVPEPFSRIPSHGRIMLLDSLCQIHDTSLCFAPLERGFHDTASLLSFAPRRILGRAGGRGGVPDVIYRGGVEGAQSGGVPRGQIIRSVGRLILSANLRRRTLFDEHLVFAVNNPESGSLVFRFSLLEGSNDWWWAIDNVTIQGAIVPEPSSFVLGAMAVLGLLVVARRRR